MSPVLALVTDLLFATRISSTAGRNAVGCRVVRSLDELESALSEGTRLALIDLTVPDGVDAVGAIKSRAPETRVVAFAPHVETATIAAARAAGADEVLARSAFVKQLAALLEAAGD